MPEFRHGRRRLTGVGDLQPPDSVRLNRSHRQLAFRVLALERLEQGDAVQDERSRQADGVDPAALAGAIDAGRARAESVGHAARLAGGPTWEGREDGGDGGVVTKAAGV